MTAVIAFTFNAETFAQETNSQSAPAVKNERQTAAAANDNPVVSSPKTESDKPTPAPQNNPSKTDAEKQNAEKQTKSSEDNDDSQETISPSEILNYIRKKRAEFDETNISNDNFILSQSFLPTSIQSLQIGDFSERQLWIWIS